MRKATLKGLMAHKFRLAATALAIVLGVSFVSGTYVLTDTITASFDSLFKQVTQGIDVAVRSEETFGGFETGEVRDPMPASLLERVKAVDGARAAEGTVTGYAQLVGKDGKAVTTGGAPSLGVSFNKDAQFTSGSTIRSGRLPSAVEMAIDARRPRTPATRSATGQGAVQARPGLHHSGIIASADDGQPRRGPAGRLRLATPGGDDREAFDEIRPPPRSA